MHGVVWVESQYQRKKDLLWGYTSDISRKLKDIANYKFDQLKIIFKILKTVKNNF
jgi:hypothetical protein